jgi:hypothetical protein
MHFNILVILVVFGLTVASCAPVQETSETSDNLSFHAPSIPDSEAGLREETPTEATITPLVAQWESLTPEQRREQLIELGRFCQNELVSALSSPSGQHMDRRGKACFPYIGCKEGSYGTQIQIGLPKNCCVASACCLPLCAIGTAYDLACCPAYCGVLCCKACLNEYDE